MKLSEFSNTLRKRAHWTNDIIKKGNIYQLGIMEETITDVNLLAIAEAHPEYILTKKFTRR